jgi:hypothetical protein
MSDEPKKPLMVTGSVAYLIERDHWRVKAERLETINAELLAACKATVLDFAPIDDGDATGNLKKCPVCRRAWGVTDAGEKHSSNCVRVRLEAAIAKAEGTTQTVVQPPPQQSPQQPPASPPSTIDPKFLTTISPGEFGEDLMP